MPAPTANGSTAAKQTTGPEKFELPALDFKITSLAEGTDIPAPEPSPVLEVPALPQTPKPEGHQDAKRSGHQDSPNSNADTSTIGVKQSDDGAPLSPTLSSSHGSIRRLISKTFLNNSHANGEKNDAHPDKPFRSDSRATSVGAGDKKLRRTSGFFRRLIGGETGDKTDSMVSEKKGPPTPPSKHKFPPPPMIPELSALDSKVNVADGGSLGSDLFKNIK